MVGDEGVNARDGRFLLHLLRRLAVALLAALAIVGLLSLVAVFVVGSGLRAETPKRIPETWDIPSGFKGLIVIEFDRPTCEPLQQLEGRLIVPVPATGRLCTSTHAADGTARDQYFSVDSTGARYQLRSPDDVSQLAVVHEVSATGEKSIFLYAFVGTLAEQEAARTTIGVRRASPSQ